MSEQGYEDTSLDYVVDPNHTKLRELGVIRREHAADFADAMQNATDMVAVYPSAGLGTDSEIMYIGLGLAGEAGELANKLKKIHRDGHMPFTLHQVRISEIKSEIGDLLWYTLRLCKVLNLNMAYLIEENYKKLIDRHERNTLHGSGDER